MLDSREFRCALLRCLKTSQGEHKGEKDCLGNLAKMCLSELNKCRKDGKIEKPTTCHTPNKCCGGHTPNKCGGNVGKPTTTTTTCHTHCHTHNNCCGRQEKPACHTPCSCCKGKRTERPSSRHCEYNRWRYRNYKTRY